MSEAEPTLVDKIVALHTAFDRHHIEHAFGGALALAYYTDDPRTTADIDVNLSVSASGARRVFQCLPEPVSWTDDDIVRVVDAEQVRLWWGRTPIDLFFRASTFHDGVAERATWHQFAGTSLPFLSANDLATFKSLFDRPKDWLDIENMVTARTIDVNVVAATLESLLGTDRRADRLRAFEMGDHPPPGRSGDEE